MCFPALTGEVLTELAHLFGLWGVIVTPGGGTLWWALTLSLMSTIVVLSHLCATRPNVPGHYAALMTAKIVSTTAFAFLIFVHGPAWLVCVIGDGFVAFTLWFARSRMPRLTPPPGFARRYHGAGPFSEEYFGKVDIAPGRALWFRYSILDGKIREASAWGIMFDRGQIHGARKIWKLDALAPGNAVIIPPGPDAQRYEGLWQVFSISGARLDPRNAIGQAGDISWDLRLNSSGRHFSHVPAVLRRLGLISTGYDSCMIDLRVSGTVRIGSELIVVDGATGMVGHIWGRKKRLSAWVWTHCNQFSGAPDVVFEGLSGLVGEESMARGPLTSLVLFTGQKRYRFNDARMLSHPSSQFTSSEWTFRAERKGVVLSGRVALPEHQAVVEYTDTDGSKIWCRNSKMSDLTVRLEDRAAGIDRTFRANGTAAFEFANRFRPEREVDVQ